MGDLKGGKVLGMAGWLLGGKVGFPSSYPGARGGEERPALSSRRLRLRRFPLPESAVRIAARLSSVGPISARAATC